MEQQNLPEGWNLVFKTLFHSYSNLGEIVLPIVKSGDQMGTANLQELPISNLPIARIYCIIRVPA